MIKKIFVALLAAANISTAFAGGLLTNTNQNVAFLRLPARDASIDIDGVYNNPAGVVFMPEGFHLGINWQIAAQTRTVNTTNPNYLLGVGNTSETKEYKGKAFVPFLPSIQAAYNKGDWSFQFNFAVHGGGGRCEFADGLGSFENAVANIANSLVASTQTIYGGLGLIGAPLAPYGVTINNIDPVAKYSFNQSMEGRQYYFGFTLGTAYKINEHLSVYGGLRFLYGTASYKAKLENIKVHTADGTGYDLRTYFGGVAQTLVQDMGTLQKVGQMGIDVSKGQAAIDQMAGGLAEKTELLDQYADGVNLQSDQSAFGIAPILGVDYKTGNFNFAAKYEFRAAMRMKNTSTVDKVSAIPAVNKFLDGTSVREDSPSMLGLGAEWSVLPNVRLNLGYHHFFDKDSKKYNNEQALLDGDTNEYLAGAGWDINNKLTVSGGFQITRYGLSDAFMNDMSFVVNSWSFGLGAEYKIADNVKLQLAYFRTNYGNYDRTTPANANAVPVPSPETKDSFTRTNDVFGLGVSLDF